MTRRCPNSFGRRQADQPRKSRFGKEQFSFMCMAAALACTVWAVTTHTAGAYAFTIIAFALATMTLPEDTA